MLTGAFLRFKLSRVLRYTNGRDGSPIKNDYSFLINRNCFVRWTHTPDSGVAAFLSCSTQSPGELQYISACISLAAQHRVQYLCFLRSSKPLRGSRFHSIFFSFSRLSMSVTSVPFGPAAVQHRYCMYDSSRLILSHRLAPRLHCSSFLAQPIAIVSHVLI